MNKQTTCHDCGITLHTRSEKRHGICGGCASVRQAEKKKAQNG